VLFRSKELFALDGLADKLEEQDLARRNTITNLLSEWNLVKIVNTRNSNANGTIIQQHIPQFLLKIPNLTILHLNNNKLSDIDNIDNLNRGLVELNLSKNFIVNLPETIDNLKKLEYLYLSNNKLNTVPESIGKLKKLKFLALDNNKLSFLPTGMIKLDALISIYKNTPSLKKTLISYTNNPIVPIEIQYNVNKYPEYIRFVKK
jgi:Leucine-rich repeat (LRR) protein